METEHSAKGDQHRVAGVSSTAATAAVPLPEETGAEAEAARKHLR